jgi:Neocarzinostatin family
MPLARQVRRSTLFAGLGLFFLMAMTGPPAGAAGKPNPEVTVTPNTGLVDGQMVVVSGTGFQEQLINLIECGGADLDAHPVIGPVCSDYAVTVRSDAEGNFEPVDFTVATIIVGTRYFHGNHLVAATHDCEPVDDCYIKAYSLTGGVRSATGSLSFA